MATVGYSLNGKEKLVPSNSSYVMNDDTTLAATMESGFKGTSMNILAGNNTGTAMTNYNVTFSSDVTTGWARHDLVCQAISLSIWGMSNLQGNQTDTYVLSMSYDPGSANSDGCSKRQLRPAYARRFR